VRLDMVHLQPYSPIGIETLLFSWCTLIGIVGRSVVVGVSSSYVGGMQACVYLGCVCSMCGSLVIIFQRMYGGLPCCVVSTTEGYAIPLENIFVSSVSFLFYPVKVFRMGI
jgi:hypothetical protein